MNYEQEDEWMLDFGITVKHYVDKEYLSYGKIAKFMGLGGKANLVEVIKGNRSLSYITFRRMCELFGITPEAFFKKMKYLSEIRKLGGQ